MKRELEAIIVCPSCNEEKFRVYRVPVGEPDDHGGVYRNMADPADAVRKDCEKCGAALTRMG